MTTTSTEVVSVVNPASPSHFDREALQSWASGVNTNNSRLLRRALTVVIVLFGFGGFWSATAPLGGAVVASGKVIAVGQNRIIQHLEGGMLSSLEVEEGQKIKAGDVLLKLDTISIQAQLKSFQLQKALARIELARLRAEVTGKTTVEFPNDIAPDIAKSPEVEEAIVSQTDEFYSSLSSRQKAAEMIDVRVLGLRGDIEGNREVLVALSRQLELYEFELADFRVLLEQGHISRTRVFATERSVVELKAQIARTNLDIQKAQNEIQNQENEKQQIALDFLSKANSQLLDTQKLLNDARSGVTRLSDKMDRLVVRSPIEGTVFQLAKRTIGEVIQPGETIMILFPDNDALTIEAHLQPTDRDEVYIGQDVMVVFPSDKKNQQAPVPGTLTYVSVDTIVTDENPIGSYTVKVKVEPDASPEQLLPGNLAEVYIQTEPKTFLQIVTDPLTRFAFRAFKG
jgi:HlyD family type I secretion membrane fusion protein